MTPRLRIARKFGAPVDGPATTPPKSLKLLSVKEAADYSKVSTPTVRRWIKAGHLKIYRAGRQIRIDEDDLIYFLSSPDLKWL